MKTAALPEALATRADEVRTTVAHNLDELLNGGVAGTVDLSSSDLAMFAEFFDVPVSRFFEPVATARDNLTGICTRPGSGAGVRSI